MQLTLASGANRAHDEHVKADRALDGVSAVLLNQPLCPAGSTSSIGETGSAADRCHHSETLNNSAMNTPMSSTPVFSQADATSSQFPTGFLNGRLEMVAEGYWDKRAVVSQVVYGEQFVIHEITRLVTGRLSPTWN